MSVTEPREYTLHINTAEGVVAATAVHKVVLREDVLQCATVTLRLRGAVYVGHDDDTEYALYDLARQLPKGCTLRSCLSCRHGHFCPVGDADNEVFCVTDFVPRQKSDLYHVTEDDGERAKRSRTLFHLCDGWAPQGSDAYTYSSYLHAVTARREATQSGAPQE